MLTVPHVHKNSMNKEHEYNQYSHREVLTSDGSHGNSLLVKEGLV